MTTLRALTGEVEVGDYLLWIGEHAMAGTGDRGHPNEVTHVDGEEGTIRIGVRYDHDPNAKGRHDVTEEGLHMDI
jgi:hypothetical protein